MTNLKMLCANAIMTPGDPLGEELKAMAEARVRELALRGDTVTTVTNYLVGFMDALGVLQTTLGPQASVPIGRFLVTHKGQVILR